jgi:ribosome-binding protein aMBF1 (putative translation factor)
MNNFNSKTNKIYKIKFNFAEKNYFNMDIGTKIRKLREAKILSQNDLALKLGISKPLFII